MLNLVSEISERIGEFQQAQSDAVIHPMLRKQNRIKTIQSSLAIENNTLTIEQVTAIIEGKRVLGAPNEIREVKNANDAYELLLEIDAYDEKDLLRAHRLMMQDLVKENGRYRSSGVGVFSEQGCVHMAPPALRVPQLMGELFQWVRTTTTHPLISSCVFHYEFEFIHPFADGNGRMGRMWQTALLLKWKPIFAWIPVESIVRDNQQAYYDAIARSDHEGNSTFFVTFMLHCLLEAINEMRESNQKSKPKSNQKILTLMQQTPSITIKEMQEATGLSESGVKKIIRQLQADNLIRRIGPAKGGHWEIINKED